MKKVTGIGGIFFKVKNPEKTKSWYNKHLGISTDQYGSMFVSRNLETGKKQYLQWSPFDEKTKYFDPSSKEFMINYRVEDLEQLVKQLKKEGVTVLDEIEEYEYGKFVHILDPENNKIELWEPVDQPFDENSEGKTS